MDKVRVRPIMHPHTPIEVHPADAEVLRARGLLVDDTPAKPPRPPRAPRPPRTPAVAKTTAPTPTTTPTEGNTP